MGTSFCTHHCSFTKSVLRHSFYSTTPILGVNMSLNISMEGGIRPIHDPFDLSVLFLVEVSVIHVHPVFLLTSNLMLPEPSLPDRSLPALMLESFIHSSTWYKDFARLEHPDLIRFQRTEKSKLSLGRV